MSRVPYPNLICPGATKAATTTLFFILNSHPDIYGSPHKELHVFSVNKRFENYESWFVKFYNTYNNERYILDASQDYLPQKHIPRRIADTLGLDLKFICVLRNPVSRAVSHYLHMKTRNKGELRDAPESLLPKDYENMDLDALLDFERENTISLNETGGLNIIDTDWEELHLPYCYFHYSAYARQIKNYFNVFPKENFLFLTFEDVTHNQQYVKKNISEFLDIDPNLFKAIDQLWENPTVAHKKSYPFFTKFKQPLKPLIPKSLYPALKKVEGMLFTTPIKPVSFSTDTRDNLVKIFLPDIQETESLTGLDLSNWKKTNTR